MKASLRSGTHGRITVELKASKQRRRAAPSEPPATERATAPVLWTGSNELPAPPEQHDPGGRNEPR